MKIKVAVLVASHNRVALTTRCLASLKCFKSANVDLQVFLVDAGSSDGTADIATKSTLPVRVLRGESSWFWSRSMFEGQEIILNDFKNNFDYILWINDDVELYEKNPFFSDLEVVLRKSADTILVGQLENGNSGTLSYGGLVRIDKHPLHFKQIFSKFSYAPVDTFAGNFVLIPIKVCLDPALRKILSQYDHQYADLDYGMTAKKMGIPIVLLPDFIGMCVNDHPYELPKTISSRLSELVSPKKTPIKAQVRFLKKHGGYFWMVYLLLPIIRAFLGISPKKHEYQEI